MVVITDLAGGEVLTKQRFTNNITIDMSSLSTGSYVVSVYNLVKKEMVRKIVLKY